MRFSEEGLYRSLEKHLRRASKPQTCNDLWEHSDVQEHAASANRVSDYLGNMWRKGAVLRVPAEGDGRGPRWAYIWKNKASPELGALSYLPTPILDRANLLISEDGDTIQIDLKEIIITIKTRGKNAQPK